MQHLENCVKKWIEDKTVTNIIVRVGRREDVIFEMKHSAETRVLTDQTLFDMASVTKIVVTTSLALIAIDKGLLSPSDRVANTFPCQRTRKILR